MLITASAVKIYSEGSVFFTQEADIMKNYQKAQI